VNMISLYPRLWRLVAISSSWLSIETTPDRLAGGLIWDLWSYSERFSVTACGAHLGRHWPNL
jgi:hypothetical protein